MFPMRMRFCDSKLRLLQTAHELIWRQSYGSVGVDQICEQSRVKKGSFYHFFRSKSELTVAAYEFHWDQIRLALDRIFSTQVPPLERLEAYFANIRRNQTEHFLKNGRVLGCPFRLFRKRVEHTGRSDSADGPTNQRKEVPLP